MAANLNTKLAVLSLEMNDVSKPRSVDETTDNEKLEYYQNLVASMNSKIDDLTKENEELRTQQNVSPQQQQTTRGIPQEPQDIIPVISNNNLSDVERFRDLAVDLNSRLAKLTLEFNEQPKFVQSESDIVESIPRTAPSEYEIDHDYLQKIQSQVIDLNQRLSVLTLNTNDEINNLKKQLAQKEQEKFRNQVVDLNQRVAVLTLDTNDKINNLKKKLAQKEQEKFKNQVVDLNQRVAVLTLSSNDEINFLKKQLAQKEREVEQYRYKLATMNRQVIDLTFNSNLKTTNCSCYCTSSNTNYIRC